MECTKCGSRNVTYSSYLFVAVLRALAGSRKRYCRDCGMKWGYEKRRRGVSRGLELRLLLMVLPLAALIIFAFNMITEWMGKRGNKPENLMAKAAAGMMSQAGDIKSGLPSLSSGQIETLRQKARARGMSDADMKKAAERYLNR